MYLCGLHNKSFTQENSGYFQKRCYNLDTLKVVTFFTLKQAGSGCFTIYLRSLTSLMHPFYSEYTQQKRVRCSIVQSAITGLRGVQLEIVTKPCPHYNF